MARQVVADEFGQHGVGIGVVDSKTASLAQGLENTGWPMASMLLPPPRSPAVRFERSEQRNSRCLR